MNNKHEFRLGRLSTRKNMVILLFFRMSTSVEVVNRCYFTFYTIPVLMSVTLVHMCTRNVTKSSSELSLCLSVVCDCVVDMPGDCDYEE